MMKRSLRALLLTENLFESSFEWNIGNLQRNPSSIRVLWSFLSAEVFPINSNKYLACPDLYTYIAFIISNVTTTIVAVLVLIIIIVATGQLLPLLVF